MAASGKSRGEERKPLSVRVPASLHARVVALAERGYEGNVTSATVHLLRRGLSADEERPATAADVAALRQQVAGMAEQITRVVRETPVQIAAGALPPTAEELEAARREERERIAALPMWRRALGRLGD